ncbi:MAG: flagellar motor protein MotB, partial [Sphingomonas sp.]
MRKLAVVLALASTALATPALARDKSWYVGVEGGAMIVEDIDYDIGALKNAGTVDHDYGYDVDGVMGYDFGGFRVETEVGYRKATLDGYSSTTTTPLFTGTGARSNAGAGSFGYAGGHTS